MIKTVVCGVSGGVDSAVSAFLLKSKGFKVIGLFMKNWDEYDETGVCSYSDDLKDATSICKHLEISLHQVSFEKEYWNSVFSALIHGYQEGLTPNPDVLCNKYIKFGHFLSYATNRLKADAIATGHYARNSAGPYLESLPINGGNVNLLKSTDSTKDQTLFLSQISQKALKKSMFPVGTLLKSTVKKIAQDVGLGFIANKKESTGICFIGKRNFQSFMKDYLNVIPGDFIDIDSGKVVAKHNGVHLWTIGQRIMLGGLSKAYFVIDRDSTTQTIYVAQGTDHPLLYQNVVITGIPHWINEDVTKRINSFESSTFQFRFQHTHNTIDCKISLEPSTSGLRVILSKPLRALSKGQYAVFYEGDICLGSAQILNTYNNDGKVVSNHPNKHYISCRN